MCFGAAYWADISTVYYGVNTADATQFGLGGQVELYKEGKLDIEDEGKIARTSALKLFEVWNEMKKAQN